MMPVTGTTTPPTNPFHAPLIMMARPGPVLGSASQTTNTRLKKIAGTTLAIANLLASDVAGDWPTRRAGFLAPPPIHRVCTREDWHRAIGAGDLPQPFRRQIVGIERCIAPRG